MNKHKKQITEKHSARAFGMVFFYFISSILIKQINPSPWLGIAITAVTILLIGFLFYRYYTSIAKMDELSIKVQMEAAVISFFMVLLLIMTLGLLDHFIDLGSWNYRHLVMAFLAFYCIGLFISRSKYNYSDDEELD